MFTADTFGEPKGVLRTHAHLEASVDAVIETLQITKESRILTAVPLYHSYAWDLGLLPTLRTGATLFLEEEASAKRVGKIVRDHKIDVLPGTPTIYSELARLPTAKKLKVENPRLITSGHSIDPEIAETFRTKYEAPILSAYFATETGLISIDLDGKMPASVGKAVTGIEISRRGKRGGEVTGAKEGSLWVKGPSVSADFVSPFSDVPSNDDIGIGFADKDNWLRMGDLAKTKSGNVILTGREDDTVKIEGKRVALGEVISCLESIPTVKAADAQASTDPMTATPMIIAQVVTKDGIDEEEIIDHCAKNLAPYKVPRRIEFRKKIG